MSDIEGPTVKINADASGVDSAIQHITQQFDTLQTKAAGIGGKFEALGASMSKVGGGLTVGVTAPMTIAVGAIGALTQQAAIFQDKLSEVYTLLPNMNQEAMDKMTADVNDFTAKFGISAEEAIPALYNAISAGVPAENVFTFLETAAQTSIGGVTDLTSAVDVLTSVVNAYGENNLTTADAADVLFTGVKMGKTTIGELSSNMSKVAPLAASMGLSLDQVVAGLDSMTMQGEGTAEAATKLKGMLAELTKEGSQADTVFQSLAGKGFKQFIQEGGSLEQALKIMSDGAKAQGTDITNFFGSIEAGMGALLLSSEQGMQKYMAAMNEMDNREGASVKAYETRADSAAQKMRQIREELNSMAREIGDSFLPVLKDDILPILKDDLIPYIQNSIVPAIKGFADWFKGLDDGSKKAAAGVGVFAAALGPLLMVLGPIVSAGGSLLKTLATIGTVAKGAQLTGVATGISGLGTAASGATPALAALFGPAGILAIGLGAGALAAYSTNLGGFRDNINGVIKEVGEAAANISTGNYEAAGRDMAQAVGKGFETVKDLIIKGLPEGNEIYKGFVKGMEEVGRGAGEELRKSFDSAVNAGGIALNGFFEAITSAITSFNFLSVGSQISSKVVEGIINAPANVAAFCSAIQSAILTWDWSSVGKSIGEKIYGSIKSVLERVSPAWAPVLGAIEGFVNPNPEQKNTPSTSVVNSSGWVDPHDARQATQAGSHVGTEAGAKAGVEAAAPSITGPITQSVDLVAKLMEEQDIQSRADAQKMFDSSEKLRERLTNQYGTTPQTTPAGTASDPLVVTAQTSTGPAPAPTNTGMTVAENDRFNQNPALFFKDAMKTILANYGSIQEYEAELKQYGITLEERAARVYNENNQGGKWNQNEWVSEALKGFRETGTEAKTTLPSLETLASKIQSLGLDTKQTAGVLSEYNNVMQDNKAYNGEALGYLAKWNQQTGKATQYTEENVTQTTDLMNALGSLNNAQSLYQDAIKEGGISSQEASGIQAALADATRLMGEAGITADSQLAGLPGALQALASAAQAAMSQISSAVSQAQSAVSNIIKAGNNTQLYTNPSFNPATFAQRPDSGFSFASGGPVTQNGPAYLHQGEYVLRRDEVNRPTSGSPNVNLNINMSNSRFGNSEIQKDLPKRIARETRRALGRYGI